MKKIISYLAIIVVCMTMSVNTYAEGAETKDSPLFSDQYIAYYTETNEMKIYAFKSEKKALTKMLRNYMDRKCTVLQKA